MYKRQAVVLVIVLITKFTHGAYLVVIAMPILVWTMRRIHRHYQRVSWQLRPKASGITLPSRMHAVVPVSYTHLRQGSPGAPLKGVG